MATITVVEGMHNPFPIRDEEPTDLNESGQTNLMDSSMLVYQAPDWFAWEKQSGLQLTQFTLVYDGQAWEHRPIPEPSTYAMIGMGFLALFLIRLFKTRH